MTEDLLKTFVAEAKSKDFRLSVRDSQAISHKPLSNDALFHLPLLAVCVLIISKNTHGGARTGLIGRLVGLLLENTIPAFKRSDQSLQWSSNLRKRVTNAISALESLKLIEVVGENEQRRIRVTSTGNKFLGNIITDASNLGYTSKEFVLAVPEAYSRLDELM